MKTVEEAYSLLARSVLNFISDRKWDKGGCRVTIYNKMASSSHWLELGGAIDQKNLAWPNPEICPGEAALLIRDNFLEGNGERIWGLVFTLYPDGNFNIEYDYEKPSGYEETD